MLYKFVLRKLFNPEIILVVRFIYGKLITTLNFNEPTYPDLNSKVKHKLKSVDLKKNKNIPNKTCFFERTSSES